MDENMQKTPEEMMDIKNNKAQAILAYFGLLVLIPIFAAKDSKFARYHANQGLVLCITEVVVGIVSAILRTVFRAQETFLVTYYYTPFWVNAICYILSLGVLALAIIGIVNAANGQEKELPLIGTFKLLK